MSQVTDIILITFMNDGGRDGTHPNVDILTNKTNVSLVEVSEKAGGNKHMQTEVYLSAMNYLEENDFIKVYRSINWEWPECIQLYLKREYDDIFEEIPLKG